MAGINAPSDPNVPGATGASPQPNQVAIQRAAVALVDKPAHSRAAGRSLVEIVLIAGRAGQFVAIGWP